MIDLKFHTILLQADSDFADRFWQLNSSSLSLKALSLNLKSAKLECIDSIVRQSISVYYVLLLLAVVQATACTCDYY